MHNTHRWSCGECIILISWDLLERWYTMLTFHIISIQIIIQSIFWISGFDFPLFFDRGRFRIILLEKNILLGLIHKLLGLMLRLFRFFLLLEAIMRRIRQPPLIRVISMWVLFGSIWQFIQFPKLLVFFFKSPRVLTLLICILLHIRHLPDPRLSFKRQLPGVIPLLIYHILRRAILLLLILLRVNRREINIINHLQIPHILFGRNKILFRLFGPWSGFF